MTKKQKKALLRIVTATVLTALSIIFSKIGWLNTSLSLTAYVIIGYDILRKAFLGIINRRIFDENFLMAVATLGAIALAFYSKSGDFIEAVAVMLFYQIGELFQSIAVGKSRRSISALMDIRPDCANIERDGELIQVSPETLGIGSLIIVQPGEKIALDGIVVKGSSTLNTSALTGESLPREVNVGDEVISGCVNIDGVLTIQTTKEFEESTVSKILCLVENASSRKSKSEGFISKFARVYTPVICISALALALIPPIVSICLGSPMGFGDWLYRALTFLVISCPCALVISVPLSFFAGIGGASREGILIKGSNYLEALAKTKYVIFDKTGTLTEGIFAVTAIHHNTVDEEKLIEYAALAESASSHPISKSLQRAYGKAIDRNRVSEMQEISGQGIIATVDGLQIAIGSSRLMEKIGVEYKSCHHTGTVIHIAIAGEYAGHIVISDIIKKNSAAAVRELKKAGIKKTAMLTGDSETVAKEVSRELDLDLYYSELLPADKVTAVEEMLKEKSKNEILVFVGDGINDAPVLSRADVGIAMGAMGSDAAIEAADIVLMDDNPQKLARAIRLSKKCLSIVNQNVYFAIGIKLLFLILGALGVANMWLAIFADVGVMVLAILNAIRALKI